MEADGYTLAVWKRGGTMFVRAGLGSVGAAVHLAGAPVVVKNREALAGALLTAESQAKDALALPEDAVEFAKGWQPLLDAAGARSLKEFRKDALMCLVYRGLDEDSEKSICTLKIWVPDPESPSFMLSDIEREVDASIGTSELVPVIFELLDDAGAV